MSVDRNHGEVASTCLIHCNEASVQLRQARDDIIQVRDQVISSFGEVDEKLQEMETHLHRFDGWEASLLPELAVSSRHINIALSDLKSRKRDLCGSLQHLNGKIDELNKMLQAPSFIEAVSKRQEQRNDQDEDLKSKFKSKLQAMYDNLEGHLRLCFLYLAIFPEDAEIKKTPLIYWWIGEGLIKATGDMTAEEVGEDVFQKLLALDLIKPCHSSTGKPSPVVNACTVHPLTRQMLISWAKNNGLFEFHSNGRRPRLYSKFKHHVFSVPEQEQDEEDRKDMFKTEDIFSWFVLYEQRLDSEFNSLKSFKKIKVLQLGRWQTQHHYRIRNEDFLEGLEALKLLKYLSLRRIIGITQLPASIVGVINLEILDLKGCPYLQSLPPDIGSLTKLTHFVVSDCPLLESFPRGVERLSNLQVLKGFVIGKGNAQSQTFSTVTDLVKLKKLRRLTIYLSYEANINSETFKNLNQIEHLQCLTITWGIKSPSGAQLAAVFNLSFPPNLVKLDLRGIPQMTEQNLRELNMETEEALTDTKQRLLRELRPTKLKNLKRLYIRGGELSRLEAEETENWRSVEILRLKYLKHFKVDRQKLLSGFPQLTYLEVKCEEDKSPEEKGESGQKPVAYKEDFVLTRSEIEEERNKLKANTARNIPIGNKNLGEIITEVL